MLWGCKKKQYFIVNKYICFAIVNLFVYVYVFLMFTNIVKQQLDFFLLFCVIFFFFCAYFLLFFVPILTNMQPSSKNMSSAMQGNPSRPK